MLAADSGGVLWNYPANGRGGFGTRVRIGAGLDGTESRLRR